MTQKEREPVNHLIEIQLDEFPFEVVYETLRRIGRVSGQDENQKPTFYQICHLVKKDGKLFLAHYKQILHSRGKLEGGFSNHQYNTLKAIARILRKFRMITTAEDLTTRNKCRFQILTVQESKQYKLKSNIGVENGNSKKA